MNGYRMLGRDELIAEIQAGGKKKRSRWPRRKAPQVDPETKTDELKVVDDGDKTKESAGDDSTESDAPAEPKPAARRRGRRGGRGRGGGQGREKLGGDAREERGAAARERGDRGDHRAPSRSPASATASSSVEGSDDDVYVSASQVRRCEMKEGDEVTGPVRAPRRGERHRALVRVNLVNGEPPVDAPAPKKKGGGGGGAAKADRFDSLTPVPPSRRIELPADASALVRAADLLAPLAFGQRVLVKAAPRAGRTTLLRDLAQASRRSMASS